MKRTCALHLTNKKSDTTDENLILKNQKYEH